jgi:hypothetical protein
MVFSRVHVAQSLVFCVVFCWSLFVFFRLAIVLSVLIRFMDSDYPFLYLQTYISQVWIYLLYLIKNYNITSCIGHGCYPFLTLQQLIILIMDYYVYNFSSFSTGSSWTLNLFKLLWYLGDFKYICKILQFPYLWTYTMKRYSVTWKFHEFYVDLTLFGFWNVTRFENITKVTTKNSLTENTAFFCIFFLYDWCSY